MSATPEALEEFIRHARGRAERLSDLLLDAAGPSGAAVAELAGELGNRARETGLHTLASLADAVRRTGKALDDGALHWEPSLGGALVTAADELTALVNSAMAWDQTADERASACARELGTYAPEPVDARPIVPIESLFYSAAEASVQTAASLLDSSIAAMSALTDVFTGRAPNTLADADRTQAPVPDADVVPVQQLVYSGEAALDRALAIRDDLRAASGAPDPAKLDELYDLIALARAG
jgi:hypothetical protein